VGSPKAEAFYRRVLAALSQSPLPFLVGGGFALREHTGIVRQSKDLDVFVLPRDIEAILATLKEANFDTEFTHPHWLGKVFDGNDFVDIIFNSGNGLSPVDEAFFTHAREATLFEVKVLLCPPEEMIWSKAFVMERERYDGADIAHLIHESTQEMDWGRLLNRFGEHWRVLLSHLILFGFIYPDDKSLIPNWVMRNLLQRAQSEINESEGADRICHGPLLSRTQFRVDVNDWGYQDARLTLGAMTEQQIADWEAAEEKRSAGA
jgi:hypothetical protein